DSQITGYQNVGGVVGFNQFGGDAAGTKIALHGGDGPKEPTLTIRAQNGNGSITNANICVGGCVGKSGYSGTGEKDSHAEYVFASQESGDRLILDAGAYRYTGGLVGGFYLCNTNEGNGFLNYKASEMTISLHPQSSIRSNDQYAGGAMGIITDSTSGDKNGNTQAHFTAGIDVNIPKNGTGAIVYAKNNIGGAVGSLFIAYMDGAISAYIGSQGAVSGQSSVGGAIGYSALTGTMGSIRTVLDAEGAVTAHKQAGGCIGCIGKSAVYSSMQAVLGPEEGTGSMSPLYGNKEMGGCIGWITEDLNPVIQSATTTVNTRGNIFAKNPDSNEGSSRLGGVVGYMVKRCTLEKAVVDGNSEELLLNVPDCTDIGGIAGYMENAGTRIVSMQIIPTVTVYGKKNVGGYIGQLNAGTVGSAENGIVAEGIKSITAAGDNAGGIFGCICNGGVVNGSIRFAPVLDCTVKGVKGVGGLIGEISSGNLSGSITFQPEGYCSITGAGNTGGVIGYASGTIRSGITFLPAAGIMIKGGDSTGGLVGQVNAGSLNGTKEIVLGEACTISGGKNTGGMIGLLKGDAVVYGNADLKLGEGALVMGGENAGGLIGQVDGGDIGQSYGSGAQTVQHLTMHLAGGHVIGSGKGLGGVIGTMGRGTAGYLTTYVEYAYSMTDVADCAINSGNNHYAAVGGVVGQMSWENNLTSEVKVDGMFLRINHDFAILSGNNAIGGVLGRCDSKNAEIRDMSVKAADEKQHELLIRPKNGGANDVGGVAGYLYGTLQRDVSLYKVDITVEGTYDVGGWIGCLDGSLGAAKKGSSFTTTGIKRIVATEYGAGGLIGTTGRWHDSGTIFYNLSVDLKDSLIECSGDVETAGAGGIIGNAGAPVKGHEGGDHSAVFYSDLTVNMSNVTIDGKRNAGGVIGYIKEGSTMDEDCVFTVNVQTASEIKATGNNGYAGGIIGSNKGKFLAEAVLNPADDYTISAGAKRYVGAIMGRNEGAFGRAGSDAFAVPQSDPERIRLMVGSNGYTGAVLGYNSGQCGILTKDPENGYIAQGDGELKYASDVELNGNYDHHWEYGGFVGYNTGTINNVVMTGNIPKDDPPEEMNLSSAPQLTLSPVEDTDSGAAVTPVEEPDGDAVSDSHAVEGAEEESRGTGEADGSEEESGETGEADGSEEESGETGEAGGSEEESGSAETDDTESFTEDTDIPEREEFEANPEEEYSPAA
ncbi:MAG: hypothetical protein K6B69_04670, partial [Lachnospiraceae bacterium]|nr:hypothetical protein [Lachnospiraceae bacterium]